MIVENTTFIGSDPGDALPVSYSTRSQKLYINNGTHEEIYQSVQDGTEPFRLNSDEVFHLRQLLQDYDRLKQIIKEHYPEDLL